MDGATIALILTSSATLILNIFQSIRMNHFAVKSNCCECVDHLETNAQPNNDDKPAGS